MKGLKQISAGLACVLLACVLAGCDTGSTDQGVTGNTKIRGVFTALAFTNAVSELPGQEMVPKDSFGPGESPAAVVRGMGERDRPLPIKLELIESATGRTLLSRDDYASYGRAYVKRLPIRLTGRYQLKLSTEGTQLDTWEFTVTRDNQPIPALPARYAEGVTGVSFNSADLKPGFDDYDTRLMHAVGVAVRNAVGSANTDLFAQRFPGSVVVRFRLDSQGRLTDPQVLQNTLDDRCAEVFKKALLNRSPYPAWPEDAHQSLGADYRDITMTIAYE